MFGCSGDRRHRESRSLELVNSTISGNTACDGSCASGSGGGLTEQGSATAGLSNSIVAVNDLGPGTVGDCATVFPATAPADGAPEGPTLRQQCCRHRLGLTNGVAGDQVGLTPAQVHLGVLFNYGGATQTLALLNGSAAIDTADVTVCGLTTRGTALRALMASIREGWNGSRAAAVYATSARSTQVEGQQPNGFAASAIAKRVAT